MELLTAAQMREVELAAIKSGEVTGLELMERAGQGVVEAIFEEWPELAKTSHRAVVLCGPGNNGGDGFVVARLLRGRGWEVEVFLCGDAEKLPPDAKTNYERWCEVGEVDQWEAFHPESVKGDIYIDAIFGTGLTRPVSEAVLEPLHQLQLSEKANGYVVAVDAPSGLCMDSGRVLGETNNLPNANLTISFHRAKTGHYLGDGASKSGALRVADIGLKDGVRQRVDEGNPVEAPGEVVRLVSCPTTQLSKASGSHKYAHGHALILSGGPGKTGAARLAARGALRIGAGLVTLGVPPAAQMEVAEQITAIMLNRVEDGEALTKTLEDPRFNALCLGPALGQERARDLVPVALSRKRPTLLDADGLSAYADDPNALFDMLHSKCVLTPHGGEFARLFPDIAEKFAQPPVRGPAYSKIDATREAAARAGCVVLFKGLDTVIAAPDGRAAINSAHYDRTAPWLATAGSGDVLAGFITGLLARGFNPMQAAETGAWLHVECARAFGPGLIAEDLPEMLPQVFRELGL